MNNNYAWETFNDSIRLSDRDIVQFIDKLCPSITVQCLSSNCALDADQTEIVDQSECFYTKCAYIINTAITDEKRGKHWILLIKNSVSSKSDFFDSYGRSPRNFVEGDIHYLKYASHNKNVLQEEGSQTCGMWLCYKCYCVHNNVGLMRTLNLTNYDGRYNDEKVLRWYRRLCNIHGLDGKKTTLEMPIL